MKHEPVQMTFLGTASRRARNGRHYRVLLLMCPTCAARRSPVANAMARKKIAPCRGGATKEEE